MTVAELLQNEELRRHEFPVAKEHIYLGHAGVCPLPRRVAEAVQRYSTECTLADQEAILPPKLPSRSRELAARIQEEAFDDLDAPVARLTGAPVPMPYNKRLEAEAIPQVEGIVDAVRRLVA